MDEVVRQLKDEMAFLSGGGEMGALIRAHDWLASTLGSPEEWPQPLKTLVGVMLGSSQPMFLAWGPERTLLYNDAYTEILAGKHPAALGRNFLDVWHEIRADLTPIVDGAYAGLPVQMDDITLRMERRGYPEETHFAFSYTPVRDETGSTAGFFCACQEITGQVFAERQLRQSEARLQFLSRLDDALRSSTSAPDAMRAAAELLARHLEVSRCAYADVDADSDRFTIRSDYSTPGLESSAGTYNLDLFGSRAAAEMRSGQTLVVRDVPGELAPGDGREMFLSIGISAIICCPLIKNGRLVAMMAVHHVSPREWEADEIDLVEAVVERCWGHVERVGAEARLRESEARLRLVQEAGGIGSFDYDLQKDEAVCSPEYYTIVGLPDGHPINRNTWAAAIHPEDTHLALAALDRAIAERVPFDYEYRIVRASDGKVRWMAGRAAIIFDSKDQPWRYVGGNIDVTERKAVETRLRNLNDTLESRVAERTAERNLLARILETTDAFIQVLDLDYRFLAVNKASADEFERIYGVRPKVGDTYPKLLAEQPDELAKVQAFWGRALAGEEFTFTEAFGDPALERPYYEIKFNTLRNEAGERIGAYQFVYDVTERLRDQDRLRQTEEALRQSQKMEAVGQLTGGLAHDFNNLLAGISGSLELIGTRLSQGRLSDVERYATAAQGAARRAAALTHRLLAFARRQTLDPRPTDVNRLIAGIEELIRRTVGPAITVEVVGASGLWPTLVDPHQLENALLNLCINARDAMPDGGRITIETANKWLDRWAARQHDIPEGQYLSVCVTDTGTGMTPDVIARAFDPFFTTKPIGEGTGLGLSMIYGFAKQSGGQVRIYSEVGQGTTVCIYLPRHLGEALVDRDEAAAETEARSEQGETVLVVDDEPTVRMLITDVLEELGYRALEAADSVEGLKVLRSDARIDLLVSDVGLPGGMNGRQMADAARQTRPDLKVLFITGYAENAVLGHGQLGPGMHVVTKPFNLDALTARIRELIEKD